MSSPISHDAAVAALDTVYGGRAQWHDREPYLADLLVKNGVTAVTLDRGQQQRLSDALVRR